LLRYVAVPLQRNLQGNKSLNKSLISASFRSDKGASGDAASKTARGSETIECKRLRRSGENVAARARCLLMIQRLFPITFREE
jgi:hypothetical protein